MGEDSNPFEPAFELQRQAIQGSQQAMRQSLTFQQQLNRALLTGFESSVDLNERGAETARQALHTTLDMVENMVPGATPGVDQVRMAIDEQFDMANEAGQQAVEAAESGVTDVEETSESYLEAVDEQVDTLLTAHRDFEEQTLTFLEDTEAQLEAMQAQTEGRLDDQLDQVQRQLDQLRSELNRSE